MTSSTRWSLALVWLVACGADPASPGASAGTTGSTAGSGSSGPGGASANGGSANGGSANGGSANGGSANGGTSAGSAAGAGAGASGGAGAGSTTAAGGTSSTGGAAGVSGAGELPCELSAMLATRCQECHSDPPKYGAPMPLVHRSDLLAPAFSDPSVTTAVKALARMGDAKKPMPQPPSAKATDAERALLSDWINAGYPDPDTSCAAGQGGATAAGGASASGASGAGAGAAAGYGPPGGQGGAGATAGAGGAAGTTAGAATAGAGGATAGAGGSGPGGSTGSPAGGAAGTSYGGSGQTAGASGDAGTGGGATVCPDLTVKPGQPWTMPTETLDQYVCYGFDVPASATKRQLIQIMPHVDNATIVHHLLLLSAPTSQPTTPTACSSFPPLDWRLLYGWAPGSGGLDLPPAAGYPIESGETMHLVMQVHYSNLKKLSGQQDQSGVSLCSTTELRPYDADIMAFGSVNFSLSPHQTTKLQCSSASPSSQPLTVFRAWPHMHTLGTAFDARVRHADATETVLATDDSFSFYNQLTYPVETTLLPTDKVMTTCTWENPTSDVVTFGETTSQEMCFDFISYYPRNTSSFSWLAPSYTAKCQKVP